MPSSWTRFPVLLDVTAPISSAQQAPPTAPSTPAASAAAALQANAGKLSKDFYNYIFISLSSLIVSLAMIWRIGIEFVKHVRTLTCLNNERQLYFVKPSAAYASLKKHFIYAPIFRKRHNLELQLSAAMNFGTLPTRFQLLFIVSYLGANFACFVIGIDWTHPLSAVARELRNRSGIFAVTNLIPQFFILASLNNPLINVLNISFVNFNLLHRWFGRVVVLEVIAHVTSWAVFEIPSTGWKGLEMAITSGGLNMYGFIGLIALVTVAIMSSSTFRHAFYETFKILHITLVALVIIVVWFHLKLANVPQITILYGAIGIWAAEHILRGLRVLYRNMGGTMAVVEALPGSACRVTIDMPRPWIFKPGQHAYLYIPSLGLWTSHPFSVAWSQETESFNPDKIAMNRQDILAMKKTSTSFIVRARTGFTNSLYQRALNSSEGRFTANCFAEGPYGGMHMMHSYGTVMLIAGGVGITHQLPHVRDLVAGYASGMVAVRRLMLVWIIRSSEHLEWIRPWMTYILAMEKRRDVLRIMLYITRPRSMKEIHRLSVRVQMFPGRPNIGALMDIEMRNQVGAMGVSVCGSGELSDDVRRAVRTRQHVANIDFVEESFSW